MQFCFAVRFERPCATFHDLTARRNLGSGSPMQRAGPFRLSVWRLGVLLLAWQALVLQAVLALPASARVASDPLRMAVLCLDSVEAFHGAPDAPLHAGGSCDCIAHCANATPAAPAVVASIAERIASGGVALPVRFAATFIPVAARTGAPARGPPVADLTV
jgi:hypothetical protein